MEQISTRFLYRILRSLYALALCFGLLILVGCRQKSAVGPEGIPFQSEKGGRWGIIMLDDLKKPLFTDEFDGEPSNVYEGRFSVQEKDGLYRFYEAKSKPTQIGGAYAQVGIFQHGVAPVVREGEHIEIIDRDGNVVKVLDKIHGKDISECGNFCEGLAVYTDSDAKRGYIDTKGSPVIPAKFSLATAFAGGRAFVVDAKYEKQIQDGEYSKIPVDVIDKKGHVLYSFIGLLGTEPGGWYDLMVEQECVRNGLASSKYIVWVKDGKPGIYDIEGQVIIKPQAKYREIWQVTDEGFVYQGESGQIGYCSLKGEQLIREKYQYLRWVGPKRLIASHYRDCGVESRLIDDRDTYLAEYTSWSSVWGQKVLVAKEGDSDILVNLDGIQKMKDGFFPSDYSGFLDGYITVSSQYVSAEVLINTLQMNGQGILGLTFDSKPMQVAQAFNGKTAEDVLYHQEKGSGIVCKKRIGRLDVLILAAFQGVAVEAQVESTRELQKWSIIDSQTDRCKFTSAPLWVLNITINTESLGQATKLFESFSTYLKRWGIPIVSNTQGLVTEKGGVCYLLAYGEKGCSVTLIRKIPGFSIENLLERMIVNRGGEIKPRGYQNETDSVITEVESVVIPIS